MPFHGTNNLLSTYSHHENVALAAPPKRRSRHGTWFKFLISLFFAALVVIALFLTVVGFNAPHIRSVYAGVNDGKLSLELSLEAAKRSDFVEASRLAETAVADFERAAAELDRMKLGPLASIPYLAGYRTDTAHLINAGRLLATGLGLGTTYVHDLTDVVGPRANKSFSELPAEDKRAILSTIYHADAALLEIEAALDQGLAELEAISSFDWFGPLSMRLEEVKEAITVGRGALSEAAPLTRLLPPLLGYPEPANYLIILQNSDELRPTGGFIGTYGIVQTRDGDFERFETHDVYHIDIPVQDVVNVEPPYAIRRYLVPKWYLRDSNWSPDWPTAAEQILWFYRLENGVHPAPHPVTDFDGVIALTPELIVALMKLTGPIEIEGTLYTPETFVELLQHRVEIEYVRLGESMWDRKTIVGDIAMIIKERLLDLPIERWSELLDTVSQSIARKDLLLYHRDPALQQMIRDEGWSGEMRHFWGDYLMVVDANLAALKTDAVMKREIIYQVTQASNGRLTAKLTLNYSHSGGVDWRTSRYRTYTRAYVPEGSRLIRSSGYTDGEVGVGSELGKTFFGAFLSVEAGQIGQLVFEYELPERMTENMTAYRNYGLVVQKQPGSKDTALTVDVRFNNAIQSYEPAALSIETPDPNRFTATGALQTDRGFLINF